MTHNHVPLFVVVAFSLGVVIVIIIFESSVRFSAPEKASSYNPFFKLVRFWPYSASYYLLVPVEVINFRKCFEISFFIFRKEWGESGDGANQGSDFSGTPD